MTDAVASLVTVVPPPIMFNVGAVTYPLPGDVTRILYNLPSLIYAVADAPEPESPGAVIISILGCCV